MTMFPGAATMWRVDLRTGWRTGAAWVGGIALLTWIQLAAIASFYTDQAKIDSYANAITGDTVVVLNGRVAGLDTLGGIVASEMAQVVGFGMPLMAIALCVRFTRSDESAGRLELLLASPIGRRAPLAVAVGFASLAVTLTALLMVLLMLAFDTAISGSVVYGLGVAMLGWTFVAITAVVAQLVAHPRTVWGVSLGLAVASYLGRGIAEVNRSGLVWLSPHAWLDEMHAFGQSRLWPVAIGVTVSLALVAGAFWLRSRRDIDAAVLPTLPGSDRASAVLRHPLGLAVRDHRGAQIGWTVGIVALMTVYGSVTGNVLTAIEENPQLASMMGAMGVNEQQVVGTVLSRFVLLLGIVVCGFASMSFGVLRRYEREGRLEMVLSEARSRTAWVRGHVLVMALGALVVTTLGALALGLAAGAATDDSSWLGPVLRSAMVYLASAAFFVGLGLALFGLAPRLSPLIWAVFAVSAVVALLGPGFSLPDWLLDFTPFATLGPDIVNDGPELSHLAGLLAVACVLAALGVAGFNRRDVPVE